MSTAELVVIAYAGRALAASAMRAQQSVHIIDCFADTDTAQHAKSVQKVRYTDHGFNIAALKRSITLLRNQYNRLFLVPCSGFECCPETVTMLASLAPCLGNSAKTIRHCKDPAYFFPLLKSLSIPYPQTQLKPIAKECRNDWLIKKIGAMGGAHIRYYKKHSYDPSSYYLQRYVPGLSMSATFIADGNQHRILGLSEHLFKKKHNTFLFSGAISIIDRDIRHYIAHFLDKLTPALHLKGLCGIDFIIDDVNRIFVLEINPRPPATFELHEQGRSFFYWHLQGCQSKLASVSTSTKLQKDRQYNAMLHLFSPANVLINKSIRWPVWCKNRVALGTKIKKGQPVCTVYAKATDKKKTLALLEERKKKIHHLLQQ